MSHHFAKPENALRKALDLVKVKKDDAALRGLHSMLLSRRYRAWQPTHEQIMLLYCKLAVDNRKNAKDGLLHYRNICQTKEVASLEKVIKEFIRLAEAKASEAEAESEVATAAVSISPPPKSYPPELGYQPDTVHYFVPGVGGEDEQDRSKRQIVTPWLKYLWDTYRTVLDVMRNNQFLDKLYHRTVRKALSYCISHQRTSEFRRLCEIMRIHLNAIINYQGQPTSVDISAPETVQAYLHTRFAQLECASQLDLWQEAYRIIEDIHDLLLRSRIDISLDQSLLSTYYEKLEQIFWKSSNPLFHTYCIDKLFEFTLSTGIEKDFRPAAEQLIVSALAIPVTSSSLSARPVHVEAGDQKHVRLSSMLGFGRPPSRRRILDKICMQNVLKYTSPAVQKLFALMFGEQPATPVSLMNVALPLLQEIGEIPHLTQYTTLLSKSITLMLLQQCSRVYKVLRMDKFLPLIPPSLDAAEIEQLIALWVKNELVRIRVDHINDRMIFESDLSSSTKYMKQISTLAASLQTCVDMIHPISQTERDLQRAQVFQLAKMGMDHEHRDVFIRKQVIETRKQETELATQRRDREQMVRAQKLKQRKLEDEQARLLEEKIRREREREERAEKERVLAANLALIEKLKTTASASGESATVRSRKIIETLEEDAENIDKVKLLEAQHEVQTQELKAKERKMKEDFKRLDYINRAMRLEEKPLLIAAYNKQRLVDKAYYDEQWEKHCAVHRGKHDEAVSDKANLARMDAFSEQFFNRIMHKRTVAYNQEVDTYNKLVHEKEVERDEILKHQAEQQAERERLELEEDQARQEQEERQAAKRHEEQERLRKLDAIAKKQREREEEVERKKLAEAAARETIRTPVAVSSAATLSAAETGPWRRAEPVTSAPAAAPDSASRMPWRRAEQAGGSSITTKPDAGARSDALGLQRGDGTRAPPLKLAGPKPSWREREAQKLAENSRSGS